MSKIKVVETKPYQDQKMGTSGLRKKVKIYQQQNYIENFVQSVFNSYQPSDYKGKSLIIGGDGRFYNDVAIQLCIKIGVANGIGKIILAENGLMSTPAVSLLIRSQPKNECYGAFILTASHNPGGPNDDMGIKFNGDNGAAIPEGKNLQIFEESKKIEKYFILDTDEKYPLDKPSEISVDEDGKIRKIPIEIESTTKRYVEEMQKLFDFDLIKTLFNREDFEFVFDALNGISGPYALDIFNKIFNVPLKNLDKCHPLPDFGGIHPDPNLVHAKDLDAKMDVFKKDLSKKVPDFGAACDGDADRNIIFGPRMLVSPSDSLAVITNNAEIIKSLMRNGPLKGVARSMPTSGAVDRVAKKKGLNCYEVPTGWKFFGNLLDDGRISLCGEESFGTGSDHIREKDGIWAILCWLTILAQKNKDNKGKLIGIPEIMAKVKENLNKNIETFKTMKEGNEALIFEYNDPVDHSVSKNQGWIFRYKNGSRIIFRFSGTSSTGATVRIYFEKHVEPDGDLQSDVADIIKNGENFPELAVKLSDIHNVAGRTGPTVMT